MELKIGDTAPNFTLVNQFGKEVTLSDYAEKKKNVVIFFYPKDYTPGCTKESCTFRDEYENFKSFDCEIIGISGDSEKSHKSFSNHYNITYQLLSDKGGKVRKLYGVKPMLFGLLPGRVSFVIDKFGIIRNIINSQFNAVMHIDESLKTISTLAEKGEKFI